MLERAQLGGAAASSARSSASATVGDDEMARVFNLGIGMIVAVPPDDAFRALDVLRSHGHRAAQVGEVVPGDGAVAHLLGPLGPKSASRSPSGERRYLEGEHPGGPDLAREARVAGLRRYVTPSLEAVESRRAQLWVVAFVVMGGLAAGLLLLTSTAAPRRRLAHLGRRPAPRPRRPQRRLRLLRGRRRRSTSAA